MTAGPTIAFHGGIGTIGGTKVIIAEGGYQVLFDFGTSYAPGGDFWRGRVAPRAGAAGLRDLVGTGYLPRLDGLYQPGPARSLGLKPGSDDRTQVFISHLHLDHMSVVDQLSDAIPVWMHSDSLRMFRAVAETGERPAVPLGARAFEWGQPVQVGPMKVTPVAVDHDIPGASALLIETSAGVVVYAGDLRLHGANPERTESFIREAAALRPRMLLIEGTRLGEQPRDPSRPPARTEPEVPAGVAEVLGRTSGLGLITLYPRNTLRIDGLARVLPGAGRRLLLSPETAHIYAAMGGDLSRVGLYQRAKDLAALADGSAPDWLSRLVSSGIDLYDFRRVAEAPDRYCLQLFYWDLGELVDLQPPPGSVFIHSNGEPLGSFDPAYELFTRWLAHFGLELAFASSTGHAPAEDLERVVRGINPAILLPIHSRFPELLEIAGVRRVLPEIGGRYDVATGERIE